MAKLIENPYVTCLRVPGDQHRRERMIKAEVDADDPFGPIGNDRLVVHIEVLDDGRQQLDREDRAGAELRDAFESRFSFLIG